ncbi:hypothetical protein ACP4OV_005981 [Aristida adscensionis]
MRRTPTPSIQKPNAQLPSISKPANQPVEMASSSSSGAPPPAPRPPWVILSRIALVRHAAATGDLLSLSLADPPRVSRLTTPTSVHPNPTRDGADRQPYVVAANDAGLLLHVSRSPSIGFNLSPNPRGVLLVAPARGFLPTAPAAAAGPAAFECSAVRVPDRVRPEQCPVTTLRSVGLLPLPGGEFVVAELVVTARAGLLTFFSGSDYWTEDSMACPLLSGPGKWVPHDVIPHAGNLWWVDLARGLLYCNPTDYHPDLRFVELPEMFDLQLRAEPRDRIDSYRLVGEVGGRLRFVDVAQSRVDTPADTVVALWTLTVDLRSGQASWKVGELVRTTMANIWADESFRETGMPQSVPAVTLMHPAKPDVVYLFLPQGLFGVDVRRSAVVEYAPAAHPKPRQLITWRHVLAWVRPPLLLNAPNEEGHSSEGCQRSVTSSDLTDKNEST